MNFSYGLNLCLNSNLFINLLKFIKMKKLLFLFLSLGILFTGCDNDVLVPDATNDAALKSSHVKMVPLRGEIQSHVDVYDNGIPLMGTLSGQMSHLGKLNMEESVWTTNSLTIDDGIITWEMTGKLCAANGDLVHYNLTGVFDMVKNELDADSEIVGGTGRFKFAEGYMEITGYAEFDATYPMLITTMHMKGEGLISSVGSGK